MKTFKEFLDEAYNQYDKKYAGMSLEVLKRKLRSFNDQLADLQSKRAPRSEIEDMKLMIAAVKKAM